MSDIPLRIKALIVGVISFDSSDDRNAAFGQLLYRMRLTPNNLAVLRFDNAVVLVSNVKNRDVARQVIGKLENRGAR